LSTTPLEEVASIFRSSARGMPMFQLYLLKDREITKELIIRAESSGFRGFVVTVDAPISGRREADMKNLFSFANNISLAHIHGHIARFDVLKEPVQTWDSLVWLREHTTLPIWLKGVMHKGDVLKSCSYGFNGVILSNHGGRQLDTAPAPLEVVQSARQVIDDAGYEVPLIIDGGIRRGSDVFKALALGADFVLIGRPILFALAVDGDAGVLRVLKMLNDELALTMKLAGCPTLRAINAEFLHADREFVSNGVLR